MLSKVKLNVYRQLLRNVTPDSKLSVSRVITFIKIIVNAHEIKHVKHVKLLKVMHKYPLTNVAKHHTEFLPTHMPSLAWQLA